MNLKLPRDFRGLYNLGFKILVASVLLLITYELLIVSHPSQPESPVAKYFSSWDGSNIALEKVIKESMKDPDSYEHVETRFSIKGDLIDLSTKFRGTNSFNAKILQSATATQSISSGQIVQWRLN